jgi:hypothetical protein
MKSTAFGYSKRKVSDQGLLELSEVTFAATPSEFRRISAFLSKCADEIDRQGANFGHSHLQDEKDLKPWDDDAVDVIVVRRKEA